MSARIKQILLIGFFLLTVGGVNALTISDGVYFEVDGVNYTFTQDTTLTDLDLSGTYLASTDRSLKCTPTIGSLTVEIHDYTDTLINTTQKPSTNQQVTNYFKDLSPSINLYAYQNSSYKGTTALNTTGGGSYYAPYRSIDELWTFSSSSPPTATTTTTLLTTTTYTIPPVSTTLTGYNGTYTVPDDYYLRGIYEGIRALFLNTAVDESTCQILADNDTWYGSPEINVYTTGESSYIYDDFLNHGEYNWKVRCYYYGHWSMWSETKTFTNSEINRPIKFDWKVINKV